MKSKAEVIEIGVAECIYEPRGDNGLEGYVLGLNYLFHKIRRPDGRKYYRVWPSVGVDYYECAGPTMFKRYFKYVKAYEPVKEVSQ